MWLTLGQGDGDHPAHEASPVGMFFYTAEHAGKRSPDPDLGYKVFLEECYYKFFGEGVSDQIGVSCIDFNGVTRGQVGICRQLLCKTPANSRIGRGDDLNGVI